MRAVVRRERQDPELGELAVADLVRDLARLHVASGSSSVACRCDKPPQRAGRELRVAGDRLHRDDQRVAPEQRHEPRHAGRRDEHAALEVGSSRRSASRSRDGLRPRARRRSRSASSMPTRGSGGRAGRRHGDVDRVAGRATSGGGRRRGGDRQPRMHVCQTPLGAISATKTSRPLAYCGRESAFSTATTSSAGSRGCGTSCGARGASRNQRRVDRAAPDEAPPPGRRRCRRSPSRARSRSSGGRRAGRS